MTSGTDRKEVLAHIVLLRLELIRKLIAARPGQEPLALEYTESDVGQQVAKVKKRMRARASERRRRRDYVPADNLGLSWRDLSVKNVSQPSRKAPSTGRL